MSWSFPPSGLTLRARTLGGDETQSVPASTRTVECPTSNPLVTVSCEINDEFSGSMTYDVGALAAAQLADVYDWYSVVASFDFAGVIGVYSHLGVCQTADCPPSESDSETGIGGWSAVAYGTGTAAPTTNSGTRFHLPDIDPAISALVVNPSPAYPVPDSFGNDAGKALFTRTQLDALMLTVDWSGIWLRADFGEQSTFSVTISAYDGNPLPGGWMCVL